MNPESKIASASAGKTVNTADSENVPISNADIYNLIKSLDEKFVAKISETEQRLLSSLQGVKDDVDKVRGDLRDVEASVEFQSCRVDELEKCILSEKQKNELFERIDFLEKKLVYQESRSRKYNLLIYGVPEVVKEDCEKTVVGFFKDALCIDQKVIDNFIISNVHRVPRLNKLYKPGMPNPIVVKFARMKDRNIVYNARSNLKFESRMTVRTDLPNELKVKRGKLARIAYRLRREEHLQTAVRESTHDVWIETRASKNGSWKRYSTTSSDEDYLQNLSNPPELQRKLKHIPYICAQDVQDVSETVIGDKGDVLLVSFTKDGSHTVIRIYHHGLVTLDIQSYTKEATSPEPADVKNVAVLTKKIQDYLGDVCQYTRSIPGYIKRGYLCPYISNEEDCVREYRYTELLYEKESKWQNIKIYRTENCGNMLVLEDDIMIGESDLIYSRTLLGNGRNNFKDKKVLILGGGDGGILHELLMEKPSQVLMVEIDEEVIKACRKHLRKVCNDSLDKYKGENFEIIIDDCVNVLRQSLEDNTKFDYVINDLTEFCVDEGIGHAYDYDNTNTILDLSVKVLKPDGKYLSRGNTVDAKVYLDNYENCMKKLSLVFRKTEIIVPSFSSPYWIYEAWRQQ